MVVGVLGRIPSIVKGSRRCASSGSCRSGADNTGIVLSIRLGTVSLRLLQTATV